MTAKTGPTPAKRGRRPTDNTRNGPDPVGSEAARITSQFAGLSAESRATLHQSFAVRFAQDNNNIWSTGAVFVPISVTLAGLFWTTRGGWGELIALGLLSTSLMISWWLIAEIHRAFQQKSNAVMLAIETSLGLTTGASKLPETSGVNHWANKVCIVSVRRSFPVLIVVYWLSVAVAKLFDVGS